VPHEDETNDAGEPDSEVRGELKKATAAELPSAQAAPEYLNRPPQRIDKDNERG